MIISFHLKNQPSEIEKKIALPLGLVFWGLSVACLVSGVGNYVGTVAKYGRREALVQSGWKTQVVSTLISLFLGDSVLVSERKRRKREGRRRARAIVGLAFREIPSYHKENRMMYSQEGVKSLTSWCYSRSSPSYRWL